VSYRNEAGRPPPDPFVAAAPQGRLSSSLVRGRDFQRYRFQCYKPLLRARAVTGEGKAEVLN